VFECTGDFFLLGALITIGSQSLIQIHDVFGKRMVSIKGADDILFTNAGMRHIPGGFGEGRYGKK